MSIVEAIILGIVQGLTEFIPVSSSGHLVLLRDFMNITDNGLTFDVALHIGTLLALVVFFYKDIGLLIQGALGRNQYQRIAWLLAAATVPAVIAGLLLESVAESSFRSTSVVTVNLVAAGLIMLLAEKYVFERHKKLTTLKKVSAKQALAIGSAQAVALIPGVSRSGSTITTGLIVGLDRVSATRFSFLLGIPIMVGAIAKVLTSDDALTQIDNEFSLFAAGVLSALISGLFAIRFLLRYLSKHSLAAFAYYRIALGLFVLLISLI